MSARRGWVYLVGAGPGDPALVTLRAAELLADADVVFHDELIDPAVLAHAPKAEVVAVGKRGSDPAAKRASQARINDALAEAARAGKAVVRLKGGDPFLFGRGAEEAAALREAGVPFEVVPGISSPVGATGYAGIPLTHRDHASAVAFVTAVKRDGTPYDFSEVAAFDGTLCVFMGTRHLERVARSLMIDGGRAPTTPCALVSWISYPRQLTVVGDLASIAARAVEEGAGAPGLLICGDVVKARGQLRWFDAQPLFGKRVLVTRPEHQAPPTVYALRRRGADPVSFPTIAIEPPPEPARVDEAVEELSTYDLVVFTSYNGVAAFFAALERGGRDARAFGGARIAAIGPATASALEPHGLRADIVARKFIAEDLAAAILDELSEGARVLLPRARVAREILPDTLREAGMRVDVVPVYETVTASRERAAELRTLLPSIDAVLLTSSSTAERLFELLDGDVTPLAKVTVASIGPITTGTAEELGLDVAVTATVSTVDGLIEALETHFARTSSTATNDQ